MRLRAPRAFLDHPGLIPFAHRGGAEEAPENTLPAFDAAVALGYSYLETDVHVTADGAVVAFHDDRLDRLTDARGRIAAMQLRDVQRADAGFRFTRDSGATFPFRACGVRVPLLSELLERFPAARLNIDPKQDAVVAPLISVLRRHGALSRVNIGSFSDGRLARVRALARGAVCTSMGRVAVGLAVATAVRGRATALRADCVQVPLAWGRIGIVNKRFVAAMHSAGLPVHVWTVDDEATMDSLIEMGVDGIMTDRPRRLRELLVRRGMWAGPHNRAEV